MKRILIATNAQKILDLLIRDPGRQYLSREVQDATKKSKAGTNLALGQLVRAGLLKKEKRGKVHLYSVDFNHPVVKQLKVLRTVLSLSRLTRKLSRVTRKIVLYGSSSRGEDTKDSDLDLLVVTNATEAAREVVEKDAMANRIQLTMRTPLEYAEMERTDPTFHTEVERGIVLWESRDES